WNQEQKRSGGRTLQAGDVLAAVNGKKTWEEMATFKDLLEARLVFVRESEEPQEDEKEKAGPAQTAAAEGLAPPPFASG
ncbi:NRT2.5, partial [Symbiodinium sp. KB8]